MLPVVYLLSSVKKTSNNSLIKSGKNLKINESYYQLFKFLLTLLIPAFVIIQNVLSFLVIISVLLLVLAYILIKSFTIFTCYDKIFKSL